MATSGACSLSVVGSTFQRRCRKQFVASKLRAREMRSLVGADCKVRSGAWLRSIGVGGNHGRAGRCWLLVMVVVWCCGSGSDV